MPGSAGALCVGLVTFEADLATPYCPPWRPHMRTSTIATIALFVSTVACSDASITGPAQPSSEPRFDGGWTAGSGNRTTGGDSVGITSPTNSVTTCDERGGWTAGSGNREEPASTCSEGEAQ
jgi:hypothetical protein